MSQCGNKNKNILIVFREIKFNPIPITIKLSKIFSFLLWICGCALKDGLFFKRLKRIDGTGVYLFWLEIIFKILLRFEWNLFWLRNTFKACTASAIYSRSVIDLVPFAFVFWYVIIILIVDDVFVMRVRRFLNMSTLKSIRVIV